MNSCFFGIADVYVENVSCGQSRGNQPNRGRVPSAESGATSIKRDASSIQGDANSPGRDAPTTRSGAPVPIRDAPTTRRDASTPRKDAPTNQSEASPKSQANSPLTTKI
ncbi:hypothetical protein [Oceanobacillus picturae]|uniref:hypothetical protein n=1 Tax=Oceanobacillus picturae TaxID=171693 RepID=UPI0011C38ADC|nr:hypothetical protein [Oceanobacillus picturae]